MISQEYETIYITKSDLGEDVHVELQTKIKDIIEKLGGELFVEEKWGRRKMAYEINKSRYGNYVLLDYVGPSELPAQLERIIRLDDRFIRFLTILLDENVDVQASREAAMTRSKNRQEKINQPN